MSSNHPRHRFHHAGVVALLSGALLLAWPATQPTLAAPAAKSAYLTAVEQGSCAAVPRKKRRKKRYARAHYKLGIELAAQNKIAAGLKALECSYTAYPHYNTYYNYAKLAERASKFQPAIDAYRMYLKLNKRAKDRTSIEEKIEILEKTIKEKQRKLEAKRREAEVRRLAEKLAKEKLAAQERANAEKKAAEEANRRKERAEMKAKLADLKAEQTRQKAALERKTMELNLEKRRRKFTTAAWVIGGAGVAALIVSAITGGLAMKEKSTVESGDKDDPWRGDLYDAYRRNKTYSIVSYATVGTGALFVGSAVLLYMLSRRIKGKERAKKAGRIRVLPAVTPRGTSVAVGFDF